MSVLHPALLLVAALALGGAAAGCADVTGGESEGGAVERIEAVATHGGAPAVTLESTEGPVSLAALHGRPVVVHLADPAAAAAWAAFEDAAADLEASGAVVVAVPVADPRAEGPAALGYDGSPLAVVVDGEGAVRARLAPTSGDALFAAAAPVLAEYDLAQTVAWPGADTVEDLVRAGGVVVDLGTGAPAAHALRAGLDSLSAETLPADLGTPLAFVGPDAAEAARRAVGWGYAAVYAVDAAGRMGAVEPPRPTPPRRAGGVRG